LRRPQECRPTRATLYATVRGQRRFEFPALTRPTARKQLEATATDLRCSLTIFVCVVNWFAQSIYLGQDDFQYVVNKLEKDQEQGSLAGVDGVWFVTKMGQQFLFLGERGKSIDSFGLQT
jgi:hypothetical protein